MINIQNSQVINFGDSQSVTVYRDYSDTNKCYIVPMPVIAKDPDGTPAFSLVEYDQGSSKAGTCSFQTELHVSDEALAAVKAALGDGITIGQFDWKSVKAKFHFATAESSGLMLIATPSMYGANRASFVVHLPDQNTVNDFKNAFGPDGSAGGTFMLEYDVTALTKLPPAVVTADFNAQTAFEYQRTVHVSRDTWGHVTSESVSISEHLQQSQAGTITVDPGGQELDAETKKRLLAWGNATLQADVEIAVRQAQQMMDPQGAPTFSMSSVASFHNVYVEGQVVDWIISPTAQIEAFGADVWGKLFSQVSNRNLQTSFTVHDLSSNGVESIEVAVNYPVGAATPPPGNTHRFTPSDAGSWLFKAPGSDHAGAFDGNFSYTYTVNYKDGSQPFVSDAITSADSNIYLTANDLNILQVNFDASNVPFAGGTGNAKHVVEHVLVEMFFVNENNGLSLGVQQVQLDAKTLSHRFQSMTHRPFNNPFQYRLTFALAEGMTWVVDWQQATNAGPVSDGMAAKVPTVNIASPFQEKLISLFLYTGKDQKFDMVSVNAQYNDAVNNLHEQHDWSLQSDPMTPENWLFAAPNNVNGQIVSYSGMYMLDGQPAQLQPANIGTTMILLRPGYSTFGVMVDPSEIDWKAGQYDQVVVQLYVKDDKGVRSDLSQFPAFHKDNLTSQLYNFTHADGTNPVYYYTVKYYVTGQPEPEVIVETKVEGDSQLVIPARGPAAKVSAPEPENA